MFSLSINVMFYTSSLVLGSTVKNAILNNLVGYPCHKMVVKISLGTMMIDDFK